MKCLLFPNTEKDKNLEITNRAKLYLENKSCSCISYFSDMSIEENEYDFALVIGGDGTFLQAAQICCRKNIPMLGVNLGKMGFLTVVETNNLKTELAKVIDGNYRINERMMIELYDDENKYGIALNDIVFRHIYGKGVGAFKICVDGCVLSEFYGDGVLVSAPTGSTAYCLSVGGPIVNPNCEVMLIQPISPHSLNSRTIIINPSEKVSVHYDPLNTFVGYDGQAVNTDSECLNIKKSDLKCKIIQFDDYNFYSEVYNKIQ